MAAKKVSASDKQGVTKKVVTQLKKQYKSAPSKLDRPVLETMLYATCLEDTSVEAADAGYDRLFEAFHDLNEIRVSSVREVEQAFDDLEDADWKGLRVRSILQFVFEKKYAFEFDHIKRKTLDLANKNLAKIKYLTPFARYYTLQVTLGSHLVPLDRRMTNVAVWLGFADASMTPAQASDAVKSAVRKSDVDLFCHLLRCLANDPRLVETFAEAVEEAPEEGYDPLDAPQRLTELLANADKPKRKPKKKAAAKAATKKSSATKAAAKTVKKKVAKKNTPKKKATKKKAAKKKVAKKRIATKKKSARAKKK